MYIENKQTLKAMAKRGLIQWPVRGDDRFCYVDYAKDANGHDISSFEYKGAKYRLRYNSGCFYPYVAFESLIK